MGFFKQIFGNATSVKETNKRRRSLRQRICRIEEMERRELLSVTPYSAPDPINVGIVYHEDYYEGLNSDEGDAYGDTFIISWNGGAEGTTLDKVIIDLNKNQEYSNSSSIHFNIDGHIPNRDGTYYNFDANIDDNDDNEIIVKSAVVSKDGKTLTLEFGGFTADKNFYFKIDVDEIRGEVQPTVDRLVSGSEMEGSRFTGIFSAKDYEDNEFDFKLFNYYDIADTNLELPPDAFYDTTDDHDNTAGAVGTLEVQKPLSGSISGYVYEDVNNNGVKDSLENGSLENGIAEVWLELFILNSGNQYITTGQKVKTDSTGFYCFENVEGGQTYKVIETQPEQYADGMDTPGMIGSDQVGEAVPPDGLTDIHIGANEHGIHYNFGELKRSTLQGFVYHDRNGNGIRDSVESGVESGGEEGIAGVKIQLQVLNSSGMYADVSNATTVTDSDGHYWFENLDPFKTYRIVETQPDGWTDGNDSVGTINDIPVGNVSQDNNDKISDIYLRFDEHGTEYNFGEYKLGSISGNVYEDNNNDGKRDSNEPGIDGVTIYLCIIDEDGVQKNIAQTVTHDGGKYSFDGLLEPGKTYCLTEENPDGYCDGTNAIGTVNGVIVGEFKPDNLDAMTNITVGSGQQGIEYNFAENRRGSLSGYVYEDANENGQQDSGEPGIANAVLTLWVWDATENQYIQTTKTATTDADGYYEFTGLCPFKNYRITETQPVNYDDGQETVGSLGGDKTGNDVISNIVLPPGGAGTGYNFGELVQTPNTPEPGKGSLSGYVYIDADKSGSKESLELGIGGVTLTLYQLVDGSYVNTGKTATTDSNGYYLFQNLDPNQTYQITETQPSAYDDGDETVGSLGGILSANDVISDIVLPADGMGIGYNFGELEKTPSEPEQGSLSGYVYVDANQDGVKDDSERGISGVALSLWKLNGTTYTNTDRMTTTDSNGFYIFANLDPNETYMIIETQPDAYLDGQESVGTLGGELGENDEIQEIVLTSGQHGLNYNFGELEKEITPTPSTPSNPSSPPILPPFVPNNPIGAVGQSNGFAAPSWQPPLVSETLRTGYGGGGVPNSYSWHLSVINAGYPRDTDSGINISAQAIRAAQNPVQQVVLLSGEQAEKEATELEAVKAKYISVAWEPLPMNQSVWYTRDANGRIKRRFTFGPEGGRPLVGDFNGDGMAELAVFNDGKWYIDINGNGVWDEEDLWCELGSTTDQPIIGDWDGDGKADIGIFGPQWAGDAAIIADEPGLPSDLNPTITTRPKNMPPESDITKNQSHVRAMKHSQKGGVRLDVIDHVFQYGTEGDQAFSGDFSGDGVTKIGIYRNGKWFIDYNGNGQWDSEDIYIDNADYHLGAVGVPVVGDFRGDGIDKIGLFIDGVWHLDTTGDFKFDTKIEIGEAGDYPVVGDFDGDGISQLAVYRAERMDSLQAQSMPDIAPATSVISSELTPEPQLAQAEPSERIAAHYNHNNGSSQQDQDRTTDQGTLPEKLQRHGRSMHTPHSNHPLHRPHR
ncbi:MAG: hypothetical protein LBE12_16530 [Planctomycetaceae bacterium]|nr:hypothetical protein [Planctomycetaceae bacterium]